MFEAYMALAHNEIDLSNMPDAYSAPPNDPTDISNVLGQCRSIQAYMINDGQPARMNDQNIKFLLLFGVFDINSRFLDPKLPLRIGIYLLCIDTLCRRPSMHTDVLCVS